MKLVTWGIARESLMSKQSRRAARALGYTVAVAHIVRDFEYFVTACGKKIPQGAVWNPLRARVCFTCTKVVERPKRLPRIYAPNLKALK